METVLVVEDEMISCLLITQLLKELGYQVVGTASTGEEAIEKAAQLRPGIVIMDVGLKGAMDGTRSASVIYEHYQIPALFISGYTREEIQRRGVLPEVFDILLKPIVEEELDLKLKKLVDLKSKTG